ncbi:hemolysin XhlA family protein [Bacillus anthracis]|uniref:hemolysin XhlA family protein n=1 Tax=Bacillus anthracis TaxID=1392 RepID=UPI002DBC15B3|nr:hemolysin XhlA family protein [Bacillus anthracis]MEB9506855.1 hemolysin XhlA family protein [Bacillus anthracis]
MRTVEQCKDCESNKKQIQNMEVRLAVVESKVIKIEESIEKISANTTWILRIIIGAIITALIGLLLKGGV